MRPSAHVLWLFVVFTSAPALAQEEEPRAGQLHEELPNLVGVRVGYLAVVEPEESVGSLLFVGLSYERTIIHELLEVELSVPLAFSIDERDELTMPVDLHFKFPIHVSETVSPYVAVGPSMDIIIEPETEVLFGASFAVGTYLYFSDRWGIDIEVDYNLLIDDGEPVHELLVATGPVLRF